MRVSEALLGALAPFRRPDAPQLAPGALFTLKWTTPGAAQHALNCYQVIIRLPTVVQALHAHCKIDRSTKHAMAPCA